MVAANAPLTYTQTHTQRRKMSILGYSLDKSLMAESTATNSTEQNPKNPDGLSDHPNPYPNGSSSFGLFQRRIEFHLARKPYTGFSNVGGDFQLETLNPNPTQVIPVSGSNTSGKRSDGSEILENGLDPELRFEITFRRIGAGLENLGNTCFLNSVLQCLTYTEPLAAYLQSGKHQTTCRTAGFCALCAIQRHVIRALQSTGRILAPKDLVSNLRCISRNFRNARQEDAHEYMVNLLESMHKCCLPSGVPSESPSAYEKSLVHKIFGGRLRSQVKCMQCSFCSNKFDPFLDLSLEIIKADSLYKALAHFTAKEQLDGGERQYQCQQCKQKVKALKQLSIHKAPYVLTIHLKRFGSHMSGQKIDKQIQFGPTLDLKPFVTGPYDGYLKYTLYGVLVHAGWSTHSGHYYCFVRTSTGMWYSLDDNRVVQVSERKVLEQKAYMLFYVRDRRNFTSKKPVDVVQKQNMAINALGNKASFSSNLGLKESVQKGLIEKRLNELNSSAAVSQRDAINIGLSKETPRKEPSFPKNNGLTMVECSARDRDTLLEPSPKVSSLMGISVLNTNVGECLVQSTTSVKGSDESLRPDNVVITTCGTTTNCDIESTKKDLSDSVALPEHCNGPKNRVTKKVLDDPVTILPKFNEDNNIKQVSSDLVTMPLSCNAPHISVNACTTDETSSGMNDNKASPWYPSEKVSENTDALRLSSPETQEDGAIGGLSQERAGGDSVHEMAGDNCQREMNTDLSEFSRLPITTHISLHRKALDGKPHKKLRKKLPKCQVASMRLGSNMLFGISLSMRKKKKHRRSKQCCSWTKKLHQEHFLNGECSTTDLEPSTSEKIKTTPLCRSAWLQRKGKKSGTQKKDNVVKDVKNSNSDECLGIISEEFKERIVQNDAMHATDELSQKCPSTASAGKQSGAREPSSIKDGSRQLVQNDLMSMLTRGLEETTVARWDKMELPPSQITELSGVESVRIGYVADEWDEEYDQGKRKKVRSFKHDYGGPNPFQEIANKKAKPGKARKDRSSSGNRPFRIL